MKLIDRDDNIQLALRNHVQLESVKVPSWSPLYITDKRAVILVFFLRNFWKTALRYMHYHPTRSPHIIPPTSLIFNLATTEYHSMYYCMTYLLLSVHFLKMAGLV